MVLFFRSVSAYKTIPVATLLIKEGGREHDSLLILYAGLLSAQEEGNISLISGSR